MKVYQITEQRVDEKPTSGIANFGKKMLGKAAGAIGMSGASGRLGGSAEVGSKANDLYKSLARWQGINQKNDKNMTAADVQAWAKQNKVNVSKVQMPDGVLPKDKLMDIMKKVAASELTGGNVGSEPAPAAQPAQSGGAASGAPAQGGGAISQAIGALQGQTGKAGTNNTPSNTTPAANEPGSQAQQTGQASTKDNVKPLKNKAGIPPNIQTMLDELTPTEKKALAGVL